MRTCVCGHAGRHLCRHVVIDKVPVNFHLGALGILSDLLGFGVLLDPKDLEQIDERRSILKIFIDRRDMNIKVDHL